MESSIPNPLLYSINMTNNWSSVEIFACYCMPALDSLIASIHLLGVAMILSCRSRVSYLLAAAISSCWSLAVNFNVWVLLYSSSCCCHLDLEPLTNCIYLDFLPLSFSCWPYWGVNLRDVHLKSFCILILSYIMFFLLLSISSYCWEIWLPWIPRDHS